MSARVGASWLAQKERGSELLMAAILRIALTAGRPAGAALLYPICAYFMLFSGPARRASRDYLQRVFSRRPTWRERFRHYHCFAETILDRVFMHAGRMGDFHCTYEGVERLRAQVEGGRGCLLVGAHFGSFEILRALALSDCPAPLRVLMHDRHAGKLSRVMRRLDLRLPLQVIPLGRPQAMLEVRDALAEGHVVALLADRSLYGDRQAACSFLGAPAGFPRGPFELAALLDAPVLLFSAVYHGDRRYHIRFEALDDARPDNAGRKLEVEARCHAFAAWLEKCCLAAPFNWFNFYDFWARPKEPPA